MEDRSDSTFQQIILALDASIVSAIANPAAAAVAPLQQAEALCRSLAAEQSNLGAADAAAKDKAAALLWQIRSRAGRLKMLLDSAGFFYRNMPPSAIDSSAGCGMDYDVLGEWKERSVNAVLCVEC